jgi:hypothetical protein
MRKSIIKLPRKNFPLFFKLQAVDLLKTRTSSKQSYKLLRKKISLTRTSYVSLSLNSSPIQQCPADFPPMMAENHAELVATMIDEFNDEMALIHLEKWKSTPTHFYLIHLWHLLGQKLMKSVLNFHPEAQHHIPGSPCNTTNKHRGEKVQPQPLPVAAPPALMAKDSQRDQIAAHVMITRATTGLHKIKIGPLTHPPALPGLIAVNVLMRIVIRGDLLVKREISTLTIDKGATLITTEITVETETDLLSKNDMIDLETIIDLEQNIVRNVIEKITETIGPLIIETIAIIVETETENITGTAHEVLVVTVSRTITRKILLLKIDPDPETGLIEVQPMNAKMNHSQETDLLLPAQKMFMLL